jgi:mxaD protein
MRLPRSSSLGLASLLLVLIAVAASAHGPTPQKVEEKIEIAAPPAAVWAIAKDFAGIGTWHPLLEKSVGKGGNAAGAERELTLKSGGVLVDGLDDFNEAEMSYGYRLAKENIAALPVSFYSASLSVKPGASGGSVVEWIGRFYRADTSNFPPEDKNDATAIAAMKNFLGEGLKGLKAKAEAK